MLRKSGGGTPSTGSVCSMPSDLALVAEESSPAE